MRYLISGLGGDVAQCVSRIIRDEFPEAKIVGLDQNTRNAARLFCDEFLISPPARNEEYRSFILETIEKYKIDFFIPCTEVELLTLSNFDFPTKVRKKIISADRKVLEIGLDKLKTYQFLKDNKLPVPWFTNKSSEVKSNLPCIYKKRSSSGSKNIFKVSDEKQAQFFESYSPNGVFQEQLNYEDQEVTCAVFRWGSNQFQCLQLLRELKDGSTSWAIKIDNAEIFNFCKNVADLLDLYGSINIQLRNTNKGPMILEINPRFSSTILMRHQMGFKDVVWTLNCFAGKLENLDQIQVSSLEMVKIFDFEFLKSD